MENLKGSSRKIHPDTEQIEIKIHKAPENTSGAFYPKLVFIWIFPALGKIRKKIFFKTGNGKEISEKFLQKFSGNRENNWCRQYLTSNGESFSRGKDFPEPAIKDPHIINVADFSALHTANNIYQPSSFWLSLILFSHTQRAEHRPACSRVAG